MKRYLPYLIMLSLLLSFIGEGATEGYTWADEAQRMENPIIRGGTEGNGILDYHGWRFFETFNLFFLAIVLIRLGGLGTSMVGLFLYERILNFVDKGVWFKEPGWEYCAFGKCFERYPWQDWLCLVIGVALISYYFIKKQRSK